MNKISLAMLIFVGCFIPCSSFGANKTDFAGRWVNVELELPFITLYIGEDGEVVSLMPMPQFGAVFKSEAERVVVTVTGGPLGAPKGDKANLILTVNGEELLKEDGRPLLFRFSSTPSGHESINGTWRFFPRGGDVEFFTFRSDNQLIYEIGFAGEASISGNVLHLRSGEYKLRKVGESLYVENDERTVKYVKRHWGCFGKSQIDGSAKECR